VNTSPRWRDSLGVEDIVFVDDNVPKVAVQAPIVSTLLDYVPEESDLVVCAIGSPSVREHVVAVLETKNARMVTFIHDRALLGDNVEIGLGSVICPDVVITSDVRIGSHVHVNIGCSVGHDVHIGDFVTMSPACNLTGQDVLENGVFLGVAVSVIPGKRIGTGSIVGAGSIVVKDVPTRVTTFGNPSVVVGKRPTSDRE
jgi:sugar O-acyltransferase (sialic acid O-acetyltransferase NeuD family)